MTKHLTVLLCALILTGFGALAAAEPASPTAQRAGRRSRPVAQLAPPPS